MKSTKSLPIKQWLYSSLQMDCWSFKKRQMLAFCIIIMVSGIFNGSIAGLDTFLLKAMCNKICYLASRSKISWESLRFLYEKWAIRLIITISTITGLPIWISVDDTLQNKDKRSKNIVKGGKKKQKEGFSFVTAVIGVGYFFIPLIPRQCFRKDVSTKIGKNYVSKTYVAENLVQLWYDYGLANHFVVILADSWYSSKRMMKKCLELNFALVCTIKSNRLLNKKQIKRYRTGVRCYERLELHTEKYLYRLYLRFETLNGISQPVTVLLSQRSSQTERKKTWRYILCMGLELDKIEILNWYHKRWAVETFHQIWKNRFGLSNWRLQSVKGIQNLATITTMVIGFAVYCFIRKNDNYYDLVDLTLENCVIAIALSEIRKRLIFTKVIADPFIQKLL